MRGQSRQGCQHYHERSPFLSRRARWNGLRRSTILFRKLLRYYFAAILSLEVAVFTLHVTLVCAFRHDDGLRAVVCVKVSNGTLELA